jgi:hypothetical protein
MREPWRDEKLSCPLSLLPEESTPAAALTLAAPFLKPALMPALSMLSYPEFSRGLSSRNRKKCSSRAESEP